MPRRTLPALLVTLGFSSTIACSSSEGLSGVWTGTTVATISFTVTLTENEFGQVSGAGRVSTPAGIFPLTTTGAHAHPALSLHIQPSGLVSMNFSGVLQPGLGQIRGVLNGSGFIGDSLTLNRSSSGVLGRITGP